MASPSRKKSGANSSEEKLLSAIGAIYDAALTPGLWPETLSRVSALCGTQWVIFSATKLDPFEPKISVQNAGADPDQLRRMTERYTVPEHNPSIPVLLAAPVGRINLREEGFTDKEWENTELFQETYRPFGMHGALAVALVKSQHFFVPMGFARRASKGRFDKQSLDMLARLVPHLQRAMQLMLRLDTLDLHAATLQTAWHRLPYGIVILDAGRRILWSNRAADEILARGDGLRADGPTLRAATMFQNDELCRLIGEAAQTGAGGGLDAGGALQVTRPPPAGPLSVLVSPLRVGETGAFFLPPSATVMLLIADPDQRRELSPAVLMRLYHLTRMEAALAVRIAAGKSLARVADELEIAITTARLHLQRVLRKTGTHRQSELVRLLLTAIPLSP